MKHTKVKEVPAKTIIVVDKVSCDLCGENIFHRDMGDFSEVEVSCRTGYRYPEGGSHTTETVDLCEQCFNTKLKPWLISQGALIQTIESDY